MAAREAGGRVVARDEEAMIDSLDLPEFDKQLIRARWLAQLRWTERKASRTKRWYYVLALTTVLGGVLLAALVAHLIAADPGDDNLRWPTFVVSLLVAGSAALEGFLHFGDRWRHYRQTAERLKAEGWGFFGLAEAPYARLRTHADGTRVFVKRVEQILSDETSRYFQSVAEEGPELPGAAG